MWRSGIGRTEPLVRTTGAREVVRSLLRARVHTHTVPLKKTLGEWKYLNGVVPFIMLSVNNEMFKDPKEREGTFP